MKTICSFSGGRTSAYLAYYLLKNKSKDDLIFVFANTGKEREETLEFANKCNKEWDLNLVWIEAAVNAEANLGTDFKIVSFETASRNGEPFQSVIAKYGIPNLSRPHCTRELKQVPINKYLKSLGIEYQTALGIRADEAHRISWANAKKQNRIYPLATEHRVDKGFIRNFWANQSFDLQLKDYEGNCDLCWKKSERKLLTIIAEKPELIQWWADVETKYSTENNYSFYRQNKFAIDLIELAKKPFRKAIDGQETQTFNPSLFDDLDLGFECFCNSQ